MLSTYKKIVIGAGIAIGAGLLVASGYLWGQTVGLRQNINTYEECVEAGYPILDSYPEQCKVPGGPNFTRSISKESANNQTFTGKIVCLPHRASSSPHTLECAIGLLDDKGVYYQLRTGTHHPQLSTSAGSDKQFRITGTVQQTPSKTYKSEAMITVVEYQALEE